jgi:hypothetical protein
VIGAIEADANDTQPATLARIRQCDVALEEMVDRIERIDVSIGRGIVLPWSRAIARSAAYGKVRKAAPDSLVIWAAVSSAFVKGFGCRPSRTVQPALRPASENLQWTKPR